MSQSQWLWFGRNADIEPNGRLLSGGSDVSVVELLLDVTSDERETTQSHGMPAKANTDYKAAALAVEG